MPDKIEHISYYWCFMHTALGIYTLIECKKKNSKVLETENNRDLKYRKAYNLYNKFSQMN